MRINFIMNDAMLPQAALMMKMISALIFNFQIKIIKIIIIIIRNINVS
jgi:hypothetical protein